MNGFDSSVSSSFVILMTIFSSLRILGNKEVKEGEGRGRHQLRGPFSDRKTSCAEEATEEATQNNQEGFVLKRVSLNSELDIFRISHQPPSNGKSNEV